LQCHRVKASLTHRDVASDLNQRQTSLPPGNSAGVHHDVHRGPTGPRVFNQHELACSSALPLKILSQKPRKYVQVSGGS
jgi:hypothetical protein